MVVPFDLVVRRESRVPLDEDELTDDGILEE